MSCRSELRGLGDVSQALKDRGGRLLAISADSPEEGRQLIEKDLLDFELLSDAGLEVIGAYGLVHQDGGPGGRPVAVPAQFLVQPDGRIVWSHISRLVQDRAHPDDVLKAVRAL